MDYRRLLADERANLLEGPVTVTEIDEANSSLQSDKSPGADGLCVQFYKKMKAKLTNYYNVCVLKRGKSQNLWT